jgi:hypothetical protein
MSDVIPFKGDDQLGPDRPVSGQKEAGISEATVRRCIQSIITNRLDLAACATKGGAWTVAARRLHEGRLRSAVQLLKDRVGRIAPEYQGTAPQVLRDFGLTDSANSAPKLQLTEEIEEAEVEG